MKGTCSGFLIESFLEENDSAKELEDARGGEEKLAERPPVSLVVLNVYACKPLPDCAGRLVGRKDTLPRCTDVCRILD